MTPSATESATTESATTESAAIAIHGLRKTYGPHVVLDGIDLTVAPASVFALLGPNGSGKTTTVRILSTLARADAGRMYVAGHDVATEPDAVRAAIGVTGQFSAVDELFTARENLHLMADLAHLRRRAGRTRAATLLDRFDLADAADRPARTFSGGMKRRLDLAMTLVSRPRVIFLDEPTTGLDPRSRRQLWDIVRELVADGVTIFLTTQYLDEADALADDVAVLDRGRFVARGTPGELKRQAPGAHLQVEFGTAAGLRAALEVFPDAAGDESTRTLRIPTGTGLAAVRDTLARLDDEAVTAFAVHTPDLDDVFLALTGHGAMPSESAPAQAEKELVS